MNEQMKKKRLEWRLNVMMSERRIKTITDLKRRLDAIGVNISSAQLGRIVWERPQKINTDLLEGLVTVLECNVSDIIKVCDMPILEDEKTYSAVVSKLKTPKEQKPRVKPILVASSEDITGPKLSAIPLPERKK